MLSPQKRWMILGGALAVTLVLASWQEPHDEGPAAVVEVASRSRATVRHDTPPVLLAMSINSLQRGGGDQEADMEVKDIFGRQSWFVPPPPPKPAPPAPPPLPFKYLGKVIDDAKVTVFVMQGDRNYAVKTGDVINGTYRVDVIAPPMMTLTFLPLGMQQSLEIGGAN